MDIRQLTPEYAVSPQIAPTDLQALKSMGFTTIINNRPDPEIPGQLHGAIIEAEAKALGLVYICNPLIPGMFSETNIQVQSDAITASQGPVFAYCASGNRCSVIWALVHNGQRSADELIAIPARFGYNLEHLRAHLTP